DLAADTRVTTRFYLRDPRGVGCGSEDVAHLMRLVDGMKVGRRRGIASSLCGQPRSFVRCFPGSTVSIQGSDTLQFRAGRAVDELPRRFDRSPRARKSTRLNS